MTTVNVINSPIKVTVVDPQPGYIVTVSAVGIQGPVGIVADTIIAAEALGGHRAITGAGLHADVTTLDIVVGVTTGAATVGQSVTYISAGAMDEPSWTWVPGGAVFCGVNGVLTQSEPVGTFRRIGTAVTATRLAVDLQPTIYRG